MIQFVLYIPILYPIGYNLISLRKKCKNSSNSSQIIFVVTKRYLTLSMQKINDLGVSAYRPIATDSNPKTENNSEKGKGHIQCYQTGGKGCIRQIIATPA